MQTCHNPEVMYILHSNDILVPQKFIYLQTNKVGQKGWGLPKVKMKDRGGYRNLA